MDLSIHSKCAEAFEYKHKKFGQVRSSPETGELRDDNATTPPPGEERSSAGTPHSNASSSTYQRSLKREWEDNDTTWEPELPCTPTKRRRLQSRSCRNKRVASHELCNAPKKNRTAQYNPREGTPEKTPSLMPKISKEVLARICQYNKNMVRKFPKKERTAKDQERRDKNTIACRMSRRLKKLEHLAVEEQYKIFVQEHMEQSKQAMHAAVYLNELLKFGVNAPLHERNGDVVDSIARKLGLEFLAKIPRMDGLTAKKEVCSHRFEPELDMEVQRCKKEVLEAQLENDGHQSAQEQKRPSRQSGIRPETDLERSSYLAGDCHPSMVQDLKEEQKDPNKQSTCPESLLLQQQQQQKRSFSIAFILGTK